MSENTENKWQSIEKLDLGEYQFVLVCERGAVRVHLWNPARQAWERPWPIGSIVGPGDDCANPTHFMEIPDLPEETPNFQ